MLKNHSNKVFRSIDLNLDHDFLQLDGFVVGLVAVVPVVGVILEEAGCEPVTLHLVLTLLLVGPLNRAGAVVLISKVGQDSLLK